MPPIQLSTGAHGRDRLRLPYQRQVNAYVEATPGGPEKFVNTARPGLTQTFSLSPGPILRGYQDPGLFNGDAFHVSGGNLYRNSTLLGQVAYSQNPRMVAANNQLAIVSGGALYIYDGTTLRVQLTFDDGVSPLPPFSGVVVLYDIFLYPVVGSNQFFFSSVGNAGVINAANFSQAQTSPDPIVEGAVLAEEVYWFKSANAVEIWDFTGNLTAPFALSQGRTYARGCAAQGSVAKMDNALFWIGDDLSVYRTGVVPQDITTPTIADRLKAAGPNIGETYAFSVNGIENHDFYVMNLPSIGESYAYDAQTKEWAQWGTMNGESPDPSTFIGQTCVGQGDDLLIGSREDGTVWILDETNRMDGPTPMQVEVSGALWIDGGVQRCLNASLHCTRGVGTSATPNPIVLMCYSDDDGRTFTSWLPGFLGTIGAYKYKASWRALGYFRQPGRLFRWRIIDPILVAVTGATFNEARV